MQHADERCKLSQWQSEIQRAKNLAKSKQMLAQKQVCGDEFATVPYEFINNT